MTIKLLLMTSMQFAVPISSLSYLPVTFLSPIVEDARKQNRCFVRYRVIIRKNSLKMLAYL